MANSHTRQPERGCEWRLRLCIAAALFGPVGGYAGTAGAPGGYAVPDLAELSLEELGQLPVTSVTGRPQALHGAAASIFVITAEDIRRSAATSLAEALRLAPNLQVARTSSTQYAISSRGFNNAIGNKLLVMVDGRTVYSPLFSGVFWDAQQVMLEDVERIEVISGAGATLWGANAVNGVINVITRPAQSSQGMLLAAAYGGSTGNDASIRFGRLSERGAWRVYATRLDRSATDLPSGRRLDDHQDRQQLGFRSDWRHASDAVTVQGDLYRGGGDGNAPSASRLSGGNLLARWRRDADDGSNWQLQAWFDEASRSDAVEFRDRVRTLDLQFNHAPALSADHQLIWGMGYRYAVDATRDTPLVAFIPDTRVLRWVNVFAQDEYRATERLRLTAGAKIETNVYTGAEFLPTLRATYDMGPMASLWASASRAVRAPARLDRDFFLPSKPPYLIAGGSQFQSEVAHVFEVGVRGRHGTSLGYSMTAFHTSYRRLRAGQAAPTTIGNLASGEVSGIELWTVWDATPDWRVSFGWTGLRESLEASAAAGAGSVANLGNDPHSQWSVRSMWRLSGTIDLDVGVRHVSSLPSPAVPGYTVADLRLAWQYRPGLTFSLLGQNLGRRHVEFDPSNSSQLEPIGFAKLEWSVR